MALAQPVSAPSELQRLREIAARMRIDIIEMLAKSGSGHPGGSLSAADIVTCLFFSRMRHDPKRADWPDRDRFVLSKGHAVPVLYAALAEAGYLPRQELMTLRQLNSRLQGHPVNTALPGLEACTGALGQGLSVAQGMALASKLDGDKFHVYCMIGDGESQEGQIWEAAMSAPKYKLDTLTVILDNNNGQIDGHDVPQILSALDEARATKGRPTFIWAHTVKGKGVSFMENQIAWHGTAPNAEQAGRALAELRAQHAKIQEGR